MKKLFTALAVLLPPAALLAWTMYLYNVVSLGTTVFLNVRAYDPRDLLAGHYLQYTVDYGDINPCDSAERNGDVDVCVCFGRLQDAEGMNPLWAGACVFRDQSWCFQYLQGRCQYNRFEAGIERFYIPEEYVPFVRTVPENSSIEVALDGSGKGIVTEFFVDSRTLSEYVNSLREAVPQSEGE